MPGKKKKGKGGKKGKEGGKLPPPPNLDDKRQGALEALLSFRIGGKVDIIEQYEEEGDLFKDKNYHLKEKNHYLKAQQAQHYKTLVKQAREWEESLDKSPSVERESVEEALTEKLKLAESLRIDLKSTEECIAETTELLKLERAELEKWTHFKDVIQNQNFDRIAYIKERMKNMKAEAAELQKQYEAKLAKAKIAIEERAVVLAEKEKALVSEHIISGMDEDTKAELADNAWLKNEIAATKKAISKLTEEVNSMEHRNLKFIETVTSERTAETKKTKEVYLATNRKNVVGGRQISGETSLPSLVDVSLCTSDQGPGGQVGQLEMQLLSLKGSQIPFATPPETFHLPPLEQQLLSHNALPPRTSWPVTASMLKSVHVHKV